MAAIPILIYDKGFVEVVEGTLINPPAEILSGSQKSFYSKAKLGWSRCPLGYSVYSAIDELGRRVVIPGVYCPDGDPPKRKFPNYPIRFTRGAIEAFAATHLSVVSNVREQRDTEFKNLTHDLRAIGNEIYHGALAARDAFHSNNAPVLDNKINQILNSQQMLSLRLDIIDYDSGLSSERPKELIEPFPKIEKVLKSFSGKFFSRRMSYRFEGRPRDRIHGPPIFEIVPFVIVENALKYAPHSSDLVIRFHEEEGKAVIRFESLGPRISEREKEKIFDRDFRGEAAQTARTSGSGIGLFAAKTIVERHFSGRIFANQLEQEAIIGGQSYYLTRFTLVFPSFEVERLRR